MSGLWCGWLTAGHVSAMRGLLNRAICRPMSSAHLLTYQSPIYLLVRCGCNRTAEFWKLTLVHSVRLYVLKHNETNCPCARPAAGDKDHRV